MPTNLYSREEPSKAAPKSTSRAKPAAARIILITVGAQIVRVRLANTPTADRLWFALPLFSAAELWGDAIHFEVPIRTARDRTARINASANDIYFWPSDERIILPFGPTPISRPGEIRLPEPCNIIGEAIDDLSILTSITPAEKVSLTAAKMK